MTSAGTSTQRLARNTLWSMAGNAIPVVAAVLLVPFLIARLGNERFGLLALIWAGVGYFSLFDLGISRGLTQRVSLLLARDEGKRIPALAAAGLLSLCALGLLAAITLVALAPWFVTTIVAVSLGLQEEAKISLWVLATSLPFVLLSAGLNGILEGFQRFRTLAYVRIPLGVSNFVVPAILANYTTSLSTITVALVASRIAMLTALTALCRKHLSGNNAAANWRYELLPLLHFGGWLTVTNIVGPVLTYFDRFFISALAGLAAVAHYVTPHELISRMSILPQSIMSALFPALSHALAAKGQDALTLAKSASWMMTLTMLPPTLAAVLFADELLSFWLTPEFALQSARVAQLLAIGILINTFARIPLTLLQGEARADIPAKIHLAELIPYLALLWWLTGHYGIEGAAISWLLRMLLDCVLLWLCAASRLPTFRGFGTAQVLSAIAIGPVFVVLTKLENSMLRIGILGLISTICLILLVNRIRFWSNQNG